MNLPNSERGDGGGSDILRKWYAAGLLCQATLLESEVSIKVPDSLGHAKDDGTKSPCVPFFVAVSLKFMKESIPMKRIFCTMLILSVMIALLALPASAAFYEETITADFSEGFIF